MALQDKTNSPIPASELDFSGDFYMQVSSILEQVRLNRQEVEGLQPLLTDLYEALISTWSHCDLVPFGSIVTGLGLKNSDIDIYVSLPNWCQNSGQNYVIQARKTLYKRPHIFQEIFAVIRAKVPIVTFYHTPTRRYCDISFTSYMAVKNSQLIAYLLTFDPRVMRLTILVKYWSQVYHLSGKNLVPNYVIILLVIFYLQVKKILPSISQLQDSIEEDIIDGWNVAYNVNLNYKCDNKQSLYELLGGFFIYYSNFSITNHIVSPFVGYPVNIHLFNQIDNVPIQFRQYKDNIEKKQYKLIRLNCPMCVQDPFDHSKNNSVAVSAKLAKNLKFYVNAAVIAFRDKSAEDFLKALLTSQVMSQNKTKRKPQNAGRINTHQHRRFKQKVKNNVHVLYQQNRKRADVRKINKFFATVKHQHL